ncbi:MAG: DUF4115 domain-containing protein, partial [Acidobacteria bacterium]|nr:DUF4115 domain-containing protein [Acidobacteriota bacterium]
VVAFSLRLLLIADTDQCWVKVAADEEEAEEATLKPGELREYNANEKLILNLGNAPALKVTLNGRPVSYTKLVSSQKSVVARNVVITKDNYQQFIE